MSKQIVQYYFAPPSPWSYLGHKRFADILERAGAEVAVKPADMGRVFSVSGGLPLAKRPPQRQAYRLQELRRWSEFLKMPLNLNPKFFPVSGDPASCLIIAANTAYGSQAAMNLTGAIMRAVWVEERNIADPDVLTTIANTLEMDGKQLLQASETPTVQAEYVRNTDEAIAASVFGAPWYIVGEESFWGQDRLGFVARALNLEA
jgi:2-hydroxychromene-2-carboxylate isomerase